MGFDIKPLLDNRRVYASRNPEETRAFMRTKDFELDLSPREAKAFDFLACSAYLPNAYLGYVRYGSAVRVRAPQGRLRDDYFVQFPLSGLCEVANSAGDRVCGGSTGVVSPPSGHIAHSERGSERLTLSLTRSAVVGQLAALIGNTPQRPLEFAPSMDLTSGAGQRFGHHVQLLLSELEGPAFARNTLVATMYEQVLLTGLLLCQDNNYADTLQKMERTVVPRDVKRAIDFMHGHLDAPITLPELVAVSGVPGRTLLKHFKDYRGTTPMRYLRDARLAQVRDTLARAETDQSVTEVAMIWGFQHLGRFALEYRKLFGESPSETHRRARSVRLSR